MNKALQVAQFHRERLRDLYERHEKFVPAGAFLAGMLFDVITLGQVDDWSNIVSLGLYLTLVTALLVVDVVDEQRGVTVPRRLAKVWPYRHDVLHFFLGSLLSAFALFYFKSSSFWGAAAFFLVIALALVGNEFSIVRDRGLVMRAAMYAMCLMSYVACVVPIAWGRVGVWPFLTSWIISAAIIALIAWLLYRYGGEPTIPLKRFAAPAGGVLSLFLLFYLLKIIPPVPVSLTHVGIYHGVERQGGGYAVKHLRPAWKFWHTGDQDFGYRAGDRVYCFFSVFSPGGFQDQLRIRWLFDDPKDGWRSADAVPVAISGGREQGYRGFAYKQSIQPGDWQVRIETSDGREIGRINLTVETETTAEPRAFVTEVL
jgi:hypothetical protein